jgi:hypothetical protein
MSSSVCGCAGTSAEEASLGWVIIREQAESRRSGTRDA